MSRPSAPPRPAVEIPYLDYLHRKERFPRSLVHHAIRRVLARELAALPPGARVLDAGCGNGIESGPWAERLRVVGIDYQPAYVAWCRRTYPAAAWALADLGRLPFRGGVFDCVLLNQVLEHLPAADAALAELARVLAPGGRLVVATPNYGGLGWPLVERTYHRWLAAEFEADEVHVTHWTRETLAAALAGRLAVERVETVFARMILVATASRPRPA